MQAQNELGHIHPYHPASGPVQKPSAFRFRLQIPLVAQISGIFSLLLLMAGLLTARQLSQTAQNLDSQATEPDTPTLITSFSIQQTQTALVTVPNVQINVQYRNTSTNHIETKTYTQTFVSGANGVFTAPALTLTGIDITKVSGPVEIYAKAPYTLRKKLGEAQVSIQDRTFTALYPHQTLFLGDYDRSIGQENWFRMLDVGRMLAQYKEISNPVTDANKDYDVDRNGVINMLDVSVILNNYNQISREGDKP